MTEAEEYQQIINDLVEYMNSRDYINYLADEVEEKTKPFQNEKTALESVQKFNGRAKEFNILTDKLLNECSNKVGHNTFAILGNILQCGYVEYLDQHGNSLPDERQYKPTMDPYILGLSKRV